MSALEKPKKSKNNVNVFVRIRPPVTTDNRFQNANVVECKGPRELSVRTSYAENAHARNFVVDRVFGPKSRQIDVYETVAQPMVNEVIKGYNCTIFAYGQTGSGKTFTMQGGGGLEDDTFDSSRSWRSDEYAGIIPRILCHLFNELRLLGIEYSVRISYYELYNEDIYDLLSPPEDNTKLRLYEDATKKGSVIVQSATEVSVSTKSEVYSLLEKGAIKRKVATTLMNAQSSRSHTVFCITVHIKENSTDGEDLIKIGKLYLVDLAGSENINKSGATDKRAREAFNINQSLLTLGRCIVALAESRGHVPYRESKLTRILQDSLGGCTKTSLIATISPSFSNVDETLNTLEYANRAKHITNKPEINVRMTKRALMKDYEDKISKLKKDLDAMRLGTGFFIDRENYEELLRQLDIQKEEVFEKISQIRSLKEEMEKLDMICNELKVSIIQHKDELDKKTEIISTLEDRVDEASKKIGNLQEQKQQHEFLLDKRSESELILQSTAKRLLSVADTSTSDIDRLQTKLALLSELDNTNKNICEKYLQNLTVNINKIQDKLKNFSNAESNFFTEMRTLLSDLSLRRINYSESFESLQEFFQNMIKKMDDNETHDNDAFEHYCKMSNDAVCDSRKSTEYVRKMQAQDFSHISGLLQDISNEIILERQGFDSALNIMTSKLINMETSSEHLLGDIQNMQNNLISHVANISAVEVTQMNDLEDSISKYYQNQSEIREIISKQMEDVKSTINNLQCIVEKSKEQDKIFLDETQSHLKQISTSHLQVSSALNMHNDNLKRSITNVQLCHEKHRKDIQTEFKNIEDASCSHSKLEEDKIQSVFTILGDFQKYLLEFIDKQESAHLENLNAQCQFNSDNLQERKKRCSEIVSEIKTATKRFKEDDNSASENLDTIIKSTETLLNDNEVLTIQHGSVMSMEIKNFLEGFRNLFTYNLKQYKVTGQTPVRKQYKFPKHVPSPKSKETLLEEFYRSNQSMCPEFDKSKHFLHENDLPLTGCENIIEGEPANKISSFTEEVMMHKENK